MSQPSKDPTDLDVVAHWSIFGQPGSPPPKRTTATDWRRTKPFSQPAIAPWTAYIPYDQLDKVLLGFRPREMEDKWFVYTDGPDGADGRIAVHLHRSWTGFKIAEVHANIKLDSSGHAVQEEDAEIVQVTWESDQKRYKGGTAESLQKLACDVLRWCMQVQVRVDEEQQP